MVFGLDRKVPKKSSGGQSADSVVCNEEVRPASRLRLALWPGIMPSLLLHGGVLTWELDKGRVSVRELNRNPGGRLGCLEKSVETGRGRQEIISRISSFVSRKTMK